MVRVGRSNIESLGWMCSRTCSMGCGEAHSSGLGCPKCQRLLRPLRPVALLIETPPRQSRRICNE
ncbi:hypothetical protein J6590_062005 [Homalodisca vitripennis]|nr:hypothetical protein J6590_062005 [Homalodisca vitripennis]